MVGRIGHDHIEMLDHGRAGAGVVGTGAGWVVAIGDLAGEGIKAGDGQCAIGACYGNRSAWRSGCEGYSRNHCGTQGQTGQAIGGGDREGVADGGVLSHAHIGAAHAGVVAGDGDHGQAIGHTGDGDLFGYRTDSSQIEELLIAKLVRCTVNAQGRQYFLNAQYTNKAVRLAVTASSQAGCGRI